MTFKQLTEQDKEYISHIYYEQDLNHNEKTEILTKKYDCSARTIRRWWKEGLNLSEISTDTSPQLNKARKREFKKDTDIVLVTSAQNKTGVYLKALKNIEAYKKYLEEKGYKVEIAVLPSTYRNPTSLLESKKYKTEKWWRDEIDDYLIYGKKYFGDVLIAANSRIRPTAKEPLTSFELLAKNNHLILPHPKTHFKTLPRFKNKPLRVMATTSFITYKNYSDSKAGNIAEENHSYGFVVIEKKEDGNCHIPRNVKMDSQGNFYDVIFKVKDEKVSVLENSLGLVWGDWHCRNINTEVFNKSLSLVELLKPKKHVLHDVSDFSTANPHESKDFYIQRQKIINGQHLIEEEIEETFSYLQKLQEVDTNSEINVSISNHDLFLDRLINDANWKKDLHNSPAYLKYAYIQQTEKIEDYGSIYGYLLNKKFNGKIKYLNYGDSLEIGGYETALHGDVAANGARGNYKSFSRLNTKMIHAHSHSPIIHNGVTVVGVTCNLNQYYTRKGMSSWAYAHSVIHPNNKNQLLVFGDDLKISNLIKL